ncbi:MAG: alpha/beta hydrolase [Chloroflexi bacterium]|nr:alpha/beta hydrolase [Chloroflexota bacterium]
MNTVISKDGTRIAYERAGSGPAVILVDGALGYPGIFGPERLPRLLGDHFTVYSYARRGRGESSDALQETPARSSEAVKQRAVESVAREIDDLNALIDEAGGSAFLYGISSGAALVLEAAARLSGRVKKLALYEVPYAADERDSQNWLGYPDQLAGLLAEGRNGDAVALFIQATGMPPDQIEEARKSPIWPAFEAVAPTLAYDHIGLLGDQSAIPADAAASVTAPALIMNGGASYEFMGKTAARLAEIMPNARHHVIEGQTHEVADEALAPVLIEFFSAGS